MMLDARPLTAREAAELGQFLTERDLPALENTPVVQRMLFDDMQRFKAGQETRYLQPGLAWRYVYARRKAN